MLNRTANIEPAYHTLKVIEHWQFHIEELKKQFNHLVAERLPGNLALFSKEIAPLADSVEFFIDVRSFSFTTHFARPFKEISTQCKICNDEKSVNTIRVGCIPDNIPLFTENHSGGEDFLYSMSFEDSMEQMGMNKNIIGKTRLYLLDFIKNKYKNPKKTEYEFFIPSSVKKLMAFT